MVSPLDSWAKVKGAIPIRTVHSASGGWKQQADALVEVVDCWICVGNRTCDLVLDLSCVVVSILAASMWVGKHLCTYVLTYVVIANHRLVCCVLLLLSTKFLRSSNVLTLHYIVRKLLDNYLDVSI